MAMGKHNRWCSKFSTVCVCLSCAHDNYRDKTFRQCCLIHGRACGSERRCKDYTREYEPVPEPDGQMSMDGSKPP